MSPLASPSPTSPSDAPARSRLDALDLLRGFALFGILVVNLPFFAQPIYATFAGAASRSWPDHAAAAFVAFAFEAKFYVLFAWLFGYGLATQLRRASTDAVAPGPRFARRLVGLLVFGMLHATLLFVGDILVSYVILGALFWLLREWPSPRLTWFALAMIILAVVGRVLLATVPEVTGAAAAAELERLAAQAREHYLGSFGMAVEQRLRDLAIFYSFTPLFNWPTILAMFALGLVAGRAELLQNESQVQAIARRWLPWAAAVGVGGNLLYVGIFYGLPEAALTPPLTALALSAEAVGAPLLTFCYVCGVLWLARRQRLERWLRPVRAAGRMSLTNYLGQAIICGALFNGWGLGLYGALGPLACLLLALPIFGLQLALSRRWLRSFRTGPDEWLLRSWTYLRWQPWRVARASRE